MTGRGREKEREEWERWREIKDREEGRGENKVLVGEKGKSGRSSGGRIKPAEDLWSNEATFEYRPCFRKCVDTAM